MDRNVVRLDAAQTTLRDNFLAWQCRLRQLCVRQAGGRPLPGMRPRVFCTPDDRELGEITVLILRREPQETTAQFRHMVRRTADPAERYESALQLLAAAYYQRPAEFSDEMSALFAIDSSVGSQLEEAGAGRLEFTDHGQRYRLPCAVRRLAEDDPAFAATFWHNSLFNPAMPGQVRVLGFLPDWSVAEADPGAA